jgi:hypothetical protein
VVRVAFELDAASAAGDWIVDEARAVSGINGSNEQGGEALGVRDVEAIIDVHFEKEPAGSCTVGNTEGVVVKGVGIAAGDSKEESSESSLGYAVRLFEAVETASDLVVGAGETRREVLRQLQDELAAARFGAREMVLEEEARDIEVTDEEVAELVGVCSVGEAGHEHGDEVGNV